jgi:menaquinone-dependent protoporphyrinogen oxidase
MRVLVTWGSERGGTAGIGQLLAEGLRRDGLDVVARPVEEAGPLDGVDAVVVGGALYANRWHRKARRFVQRHVDALRRVPVWFFSSGPLDDSADRGEIAPTGQVAALMARVGARGHVTFGGRLEADARGFPAQAMAKKLHGDWRNPARIRGWADELAAVLPSARPGHAVEPAARSLPRLAGHVLAAAGILAAVRLALGGVLDVGAGAIALHALVAVLVTGVVAGSYFRPRGAREPMPVAITFAAAAAALDALVLARTLTTTAGLVALATSAIAVLLTAWTAGGIASTLPWPKPPAAARAPQ